MHEDQEDFRDGHGRRESDGAGSTERWVKWGVGTALVLTGSMWSFAWNQQQRINTAEKDIAILQTRQETYARERMELDQRSASIMQKLSDQHDRMLQIVEDAQSRRGTSGDATTPAFPNRYNR